MALNPEQDETLAMSGPTPITRRPRTPDSQRFAPGTLVASRYRIISRLGAGGMGEVFRADDIVLGQPVALKFLPESARTNVSLLTRFYDEVRIARQISHANVCRVYDIGEIEGQPYLSMEYIDGEDLAGLLRRIGRLPGDKAAEFARKMCAGLAAAHAQGVLHRDIKPGNIMIDGRGEPRITDFGLAAVATGIEGHEIRNGTPAYMAPEQLEGREVSVQSDLYALGLVFHEMFTGKPAHEAATVAELTKLRTTTTVSKTSTLVADLDPAVERAIEACLQPDPKLRPSSALELARMLPGGDPLAAALAAGQTPSPEMVAASGSTGALRPKVAISILAAMSATLLAALLLADYMALFNKLPLQYPPEVLTARAREAVIALGYRDEPNDHAISFTRDNGLITYLRDHLKTREEWTEAVHHPPHYVNFWYRASPAPLRSTFLSSSGQITEADPPMTLPGMTSISLGLDGRLRRFNAVPPRAVDAKTEPAAPVDWSSVFKLARLDINQFQRTEPQWTALAANDERVAWTGKYPTQFKNAVEIPIRVEAASFQGRPVYFEVLGSWEKPPEAGVSTKSLRELITDRFFLSLIALLILAAFVMAWHHWKSGRGDLTGAMRVGAYVALANAANWILRAHYSDIDGNVEQFAYLAGATLYGAAIFGVLYLALEPWVRRYWPQVLVTWTRVLRGDFKSPQVGRDALIGAALGVLFITWIAVMQLFVLKIGEQGPEGFYLGNLLGFRYSLGIFINYFGNSIASLTTFLVFGFFLRIILRKEWLVAVLFVVLGALFQASGTEVLFWQVFAVDIGIYALLMVALMRFGLFASVVMLFVTNTLGDGLATTHLSAWYGTSTWLSILLVMTVAIWGYFVAVAGQPLLGAPEKLEPARYNR